MLRVARSGQESRSAAPRAEPTLAGYPSQRGNTMTKTQSYEGFTEEEREAMKERSAELKKSSRGGASAKKAAADEQDVLDKIAEMPEPDRVIAEKLYDIV